MSKPAEWFDEDYYERGLETGKSCYQNYRWIPELTIPMAMTIIDLLNIKRVDNVLDFGCGKGYLVKALRLLHRRAFGVDISKYALANVDHSVKKFCSSPDVKHCSIYDICIAKDVFEHVSYEQILPVLKGIKAIQIFAVIPLGRNGKYFAEANNLDQSHEICEDLDWWEHTLQSAGWITTEIFDECEGIKSHYGKGTHGFFIAVKDSSL